MRWDDRTGDGAVNNAISGGSYYAPVLQGRDFPGTSFNTPAPPRPDQVGTGE
ncbi:hypothetical protein SAMN05216489_09526 [Streptomyces sp. 3213]|uniref:hypothetical protein n=1 Tax=Streptomyces sp. 3213.3 TaxID=1855348 RepID=UPI00089A1CAB|nr:hypothetical protein [Streptomyces sp. 3213.3]SEF00311.1 hypothetical protein SAMN05216489_09526 [Streptomyces sp. 3213] [Streptomyces sp. 3213.3]